MPPVCRRPLGIAIAAVLYGTGLPALAEEAANDYSLDEVVVTATRRSESVLSIPASIQAISGKQLSNAGVSDLSGLVRLAPGLSIFDEGPRASGNRNTFNIRGLNADNVNNNDDNPSLTQSAVSTYLGEIPVFFPFKLVDMDRVEVLKGPQGTLYGASSIGGTVRFIPNAPDPKNLSVDVNAKLSMTQHAAEPSYDGSVTLNLPIGPTSAIRATVGHEYLSGFINADGLVQQTGSASNPGQINLQNPSDFLGSAPANAPVDKDYNNADLDYFRGAAKVGVGERVTVSLNIAYQEINANGRNEDNPYYGSGKEYQYYTAFTDPQHSAAHVYDLDVAVDMGFATMTSATGATGIYTKSISDSSGYLRTNLSSYYAGFPRLYAPIRRTQESDAYSEELRLVSKPSGFIDWIAGAFYRSSHTSFDLLQTAPGISDYTNEVYGISPALNFTDTLATGYTSTTFKDAALFGEVTWHVTDKWQVTGGGRVFHDTLNGISGTPLPYASLTTQYFESGVADNPYLLGSYQPISSTTNDHIFKFNTSYSFTPDMLGYATISQGFRPGGANALPASDPLGDNNRPYLLYKPDTDTNYEIGIKGKVHDRFSYTATAFLINWKDFQATLATPFGVNFVANVAPARSEGIEVQLDGQLTSRVTAGLNYTYIDAYVRQSFDTLVGDPTTNVPARSPLPGSAKNTFSEYLQYTQPLPGSSLLFQVNGSYKGPSQSNFANLPDYPANDFVHFASIDVWGGSVTWDKGPYSVAVFGDNLTDNRGTSIASSAAFYGDRDQGYGVIRPRTVGLRFHWSYQ
jgi:outer membrane receptor protein involved in Fe transport